MKRRGAFAGSPTKGIFLLYSKWQWDFNAIMEEEKAKNVGDL